MTTTNTTAQIATFLNVAPNAIKSVTEMAWVFCVVVKGCRARFVSKKVVKEQTMALFQVKTGSEYHTTERRGAMVTVNGKPIYEALKANSKSWTEVGNKGRHGKWCVAEYDIPIGAAVVFTATANGREKIEHSFVVSDESIEFDGYKYGGSTCGWIVSI